MRMMITGMLQVGRVKGGGKDGGREGCYSVDYTH